MADPRQDREELRLATAAVDGLIPPIWYRQRMVALAADQDPSLTIDDEPGRVFG